MIELVSLSLKLISFETNGNFYNQKDGLFIGTPNYPCFAEIYIQREDKRVELESLSVEFVLNEINWNFYNQKDGLFNGASTFPCVTEIYINEWMEERWVLLNRQPTSIHLHPAHFSLTPAFCNTLKIIRTKVFHVIGQFLQIQTEKFKVVRFSWKLAHMHVGGADSNSELRFLKFWPQSSFLGNLGLKKLKLFVLPENWHLWYLGRSDSKSGVRFSKFRQ